MTKRHDWGPSKYEKCQWAMQAIEFLMENNGHVQVSKTDFAYLMAQRYGRPWLRKDGTGDRRLVEEVCNLTRDQDTDPFIARELQGFKIAYAPTRGGLTLLDPSGELRLPDLIHMLSGDMHQQQSHKTVNRRRLGDWKSLARMAINSGHTDLGLISGQIEHEIETTGFASDSLVVDFEAELMKLHLESAA